MYKDLDLRIIECLQKDGRASLRKVAEELSVSTTTVSHHLKALLQRGVIRGFAPILDWPKLGFNLTAITLIKAKGNKIPEIVGTLKGDENLTHVYEITGEFDILVIGKYKDQDRMNAEIKRLLSHPAILETNTSVVLALVKEGAWVRLY
jgi:DNA-binding Lrp family transcriptional regulator